MTILRSKIFLGIIFYLLIAPVSGCSGEHYVSGNKVGDPALDFSLKSLEGKEINLKGYRENKAVYLIFWATWCPACCREVSHLKEVFQEFKTKEIELLTINVGKNDPLNRVIRFKERNGLTYPVLYDEGGRVSRAYNIVGIPAHILIDKEGIIKYRAHQLPRDVSAYLK